jgi:hypothetical protein
MSCEGQVFVDGDRLYEDGHHWVLGIARIGHAGLPTEQRGE